MSKSVNRLYTSTGFIPIAISPAFFGLPALTFGDAAAFGATAFFGADALAFGEAGSAFSDFFAMVTVASGPFRLFGFAGANLVRNQIYQLFSVKTLETGD